ncbi:protein-disulfide reductase DsbD domain-containing protein [Chitinophaga varians]|uniref:protein-disulfide reductase DsbD domain-containing protein n=1 Tax=Chitinophaga varians TaxID=2202339 RepID=UPI00165F9026|nr:protein-disulfide reductase DsbD domain-containing protein [Chitinophaga varians]MBC9909260.1 hypothetical protein [Chitinophaga varians]
MKSLLVTLSLFLLPRMVFSQIENPVKWTFSAKKIDAKRYELQMTAIIDTRWHIYAQETGEGPIPTSFHFTKNPLVTPVGKMEERGSLQKAYDSNFKTTLKYYERKVDFIQQVTLKGLAATKVKGYVEFMACDDHQCLPSKQVEFSVNVGGK